jgi:hypothetical protein
MPNRRIEQNATRSAAQRQAGARLLMRKALGKHMTRWRRPEGPRPLRRALLLLAAMAAGLAIGAALSRVHSLDTAKVFWVSNLAAPWLAVAFVAGWPGAGADLPACVVAFYAQSLWFVRIRFHHTGGSLAWEPADKSITAALTCA